MDYLGACVAVCSEKLELSETAATDQQPDYDNHKYERHQASSGAVVTIAIVATAAAEQQN